MDTKGIKDKIEYLLSGCFGVHINTIKNSKIIQKWLEYPVYNEELQELQNLKNEGNEYLKKLTKLNNGLDFNQELIDKVNKTSKNIFWSVGIRTIGIIGIYCFIAYIVSYILLDNQIVNNFFGGLILISVPIVMFKFGSLFFDILEEWRYPEIHAIKEAKKILKLLEEND